MIPLSTITPLLSSLSNKNTTHQVNLMVTVATQIIHLKGGNTRRIQTPISHILHPLKAITLNTHKVVTIQEGIPKEVTLKDITLKMEVIPKEVQPQRVTPKGATFKAITRVTLGLPWYTMMLVHHILRVATMAITEYTHA